MERSLRRRADALSAAQRQVDVVNTAQRDLERFVARALHWGATWAEVADALGVTRQSAHRRYRDLRYDPVEGTTWHEPPLPL